MLSGRHDPFSVPPENVTTGQLFMLLQSINAKQSLIVAEQTRLRSDFEKDRAQMADMVAAWKAGGTVLRIIRLAGAVALALGAVWAFTKGVVAGSGS